MNNSLEEGKEETNLEELELSANKKGQESFAIIAENRDTWNKFGNIDYEDS